MTLEHLLSPVSPAEFFRETWERSSLLLRRTDKGHFDGLLTVEDIERHVFGNRNLSPAAFRVCKGSEMLEASAWCEQLVRDDASVLVASPDKLLAALRRGFSLYLHFPERMFPGLAATLTGLERALRVTALSHLIIAPPRAQGFLPHTDPYGVFVLQLSGRKTWHTYGVRNPLGASRGVDHHHLANEVPAERFELSAGDVLYLPRGAVHSAHTCDTGSIHLSLAVVPPRGHDVLSLVAELAERNAFFQEYLPFGLAGEHEDRVAWASRFKHEVRALLDHVDLFDLIEHRHQARMAGGPAERPLTMCLEIEAVSPETMVRVRDGLRWRLGLDPASGRCRLSYGTGVLEFPGSWLCELETLFGAGAFMVQALGDAAQVALPERVQVARNLLHAGVLALVDTKAG